MSTLSLAKLVRNTLVNDSTLRGFLGVTTTSSAPVSPVFMEMTGLDKQITYSFIDGPTDPGMNSQNGILTLHVQVQATGGVNPHKTYGDIVNRISGLFDDVIISGAGYSGTAICGLHFIRTGGPATIYDENRKFLTKIVSYSYKVIGG